MDEDINGYITCKTCEFKVGGGGGGVRRECEEQEGGSGHHGCGGDNLGTRRLDLGGDPASASGG